MLKVGITGGIGSGKTSACLIFKTLGIPVYDADTRAKELMNTDPELKTTLEGYFGKDIYENGMLDRKKLSAIIFNDRDALEKVNGSVHPAVECDFKQWCIRQTAPYIMEEAAIIFESGIAQRFGKVILVTAPIELRIKRVCDRDHASPEAVRARINNQWPDEKKMALADYVIYNDDMRLMTLQVMDIHRKLLEISEEDRKAMRS